MLLISICFYEIVQRTSVITSPPLHTSRPHKPSAEDAAVSPTITICFKCLWWAKCCGGPSRDKFPVGVPEKQDRVCTYLASQLWRERRYSPHLDDEPPTKRFRLQPRKRLLAILPMPHFPVEGESTRHPASQTTPRERKDADTHHNEPHCLPAETVLWRPHHQIYQCKQVSLKKLISKDFLTRLDGSFQNKRGFHEKESDRWSNQLEWLPVPRKVLDNYTTSTYRTVSLHRLYFFCD